MPDKYTHVSFDIETLDTTPSALVLSIGAAKFNLDDDETYDEIKDDSDRCFYASLELQSQLFAGRTISADTLKWWMEQSREAQKVFLENKHDTVNGLCDLSAFCKDTNYAWGNGNMFDNVIIRNLYGSYNMTYPYHYSRDLDLRTLKIAAGNPKVQIHTEANTNVKHNALDDAVFQAVLAQQFWKSIYGE